MRYARLLAVLFVLAVTAQVQSQSTPSTANQLTYVSPLITQPVDEHDRVVLKGNTHPLARATYDKGPAPDDLPMNRMLLVLKRSADQERSLRSLLDAQQDKHSPQYHKWLTADEFGKQFGVADSDVQAVTVWLKNYGFQVAGVAHGRSTIEFSGTAAQVQEAFGTSIHKYEVNGEQHWANSSDPQIPAALAPAVAGVRTLHNFLKKPHIRLVDQSVSANYKPGKSPQLTFPGSPPSHALAPADLKTIYGENQIASSGVTGQGITIAVVGRSNLYGVQGGFGQAQDVLNFRGLFNVCCGNVFVSINGPDPGDLGGIEESEATLDASWAGALAPDAQINFVVSASTNATDGVELSELYIIDNNLAQVMTESFGGCEQAVTTAEATSIEALAEQAAAQGITYLVSSGDSGSAGCDDPTSVPETHGLSVNVLASSPYTVAVGGTMFNENGQDSKYWSSTNSSTNLGSALSYIPENVWNESCTSATCGNNAGLWSGGGGSSVLFSKPAWQTGFGPSDGARDLPDVSLTAAGHDFYLICLEGSCIPDALGYLRFAGAAGTSASTPSFAGVMALVDQQMGGRQGQADYVLYRLASTETFSQCNGSNTSVSPANTCTFNDTTSGNNCVPGEMGYPSSCTTYNSGTGYDLATGLGSVNISNLVTNWNRANFNATTTNLALTPNQPTFTHGAGITADISVTGNGGMPTGDVSLTIPNLFAGLCTTPNACTLKAGTGTTGTVSVTTHNFPGGSYPLQAHYAGDGDFAPSDSGLVSVTVNPEASSTKLVVASGFDANGNPIPFTMGPYGGLIYLQATVSGQSGFGTPTGVVQFADNGSGLSATNQLNPLGQLNSSAMAWTPNGIFSVGVGTRTISANYLGDASFNPSSANSATVTITQASSTTTVTLPDGGQGGTTLMATVNSASRGTPPTGTVTFYSGNTSLGSATLSPSSPQPGTAQSSAFLMSPISGNPSLTATYGGDTNYAGSTSPVLVASPDFVLSSNAGAGTVLATPGQSTGAGLSVTSIDGFSGNVSFSCTGVPAETTCTISPQSVTIGANTAAASASFTLQTTAPTALLLPRPGRNWNGWTSVGMTLIAGIVLLPYSLRSRVRVSREVSVLLMMFLLSTIGCSGGGGSSGSGGGGGGGGGSNQGTPTGSYTITFQASSGSVIHTVNIKLIVE